MTRSPEATETLGRALGRLLGPGAFLGLEGAMGAGKTCLVRGLCDGLGVDLREVSSPSYALVHTYRGRLPVFHVDLYRISDPDEVEATGLLDTAEEGVILVEWIDRAMEIFPLGGIRITIESLPREVDPATVEIEDSMKRGFWLRCKVPAAGCSAEALMACARELSAAG